jgi:SnoaL-like polyketide cyclase
MYPALHSKLAWLGFGLVTLSIASCSQGTPDSKVQGTQTSSVEATELAKIRAMETQEQKNLEVFDDLDFNVYSGQKWDEFHRSHAANIIVHYPDGHTTTGLEAHLAELKPQFVFAPDTKIKTHPIKVAQDSYTAVMGVMEGTFTQPMPNGDGKTIPPTNKPFKLPMTTIGRWENGVMVEEWLFWDNQAFMKQIGLAQ